VASHVTKHPHHNHLPPTAASEDQTSSFHLGGLEDKTKLDFAHHMGLAKGSCVQESNMLTVLKIFFISLDTSGGHNGVIAVGPIQWAIKATKEMRTFCTFFDGPPNNRQWPTFLFH
jgi:hypothetical protein